MKCAFITWLNAKYVFLLKIKKYAFYTRTLQNEYNPKP
jgi:hypothetical protein